MRRYQFKQLSKEAMEHALQMEYEFQEELLTTEMGEAYDELMHYVRIAEYPDPDNPWDWLVSWGEFVSIPSKAKSRYAQTLVKEVVERIGFFDEMLTEDLADELDHAYGRLLEKEADNLYVDKDFLIKSIEANEYRFNSRGEIV